MMDNGFKGIGTLSLAGFFPKLYTGLTWKYITIQVSQLGPNPGTPAPGASVKVPSPAVV